jgi:hypothetical protein
VALYLAAQRLGRSQYSLLPVSQLNDGTSHALQNPASSKGKAADSPAAAAAAFATDADGVFSREASKQLALAECGAGSRGGSFTAGLRQQGSLHMRSDSANDDSAQVSGPRSPSNYMGSCRVWGGTVGLLHSQPHQACKPGSGQCRV